MKAEEKSPFHASVIEQPSGKVYGSKKVDTKVFQLQKAYFKFFDKQENQTES